MLQHLPFGAEIFFDHALLAQKELEICRFSSLLACSCGILNQAHGSASWTQAVIVNAATSEKLAEIDQVKNIAICELVAQDQSMACPNGAEFLDPSTYSSNLFLSQNTILNYKPLASWIQGLYLRVLGVCDSQCLVITRDWCNKDLDDSLLSKACQVKQDGSSLSTLGDFDKCQVYGHSESQGKILEIASQLSKSTALRIPFFTSQI